MRNRKTLLEAATEAADAFADALDDLELWAQCGSEGMTPEEKKRFRKYHRILQMLNRTISRQPKD